MAWRSRTRALANAARLGCVLAFRCGALALWLHASAGCALSIFGAEPDSVRDRYRSSGVHTHGSGRRPVNGAATLSPEACYAELSANHVRFEHVASGHARG